MQSVRLITECVDAPRFLAYCSQNCGNFVSIALDPDADLVTNLKAFVDLVMKHGWRVGLLGNLCPTHVDKLNAPSLILPNGRVN